MRPSGKDLDDIRALLRDQTAASLDDQDTQLMTLCCVQLFNAGQLADVLTIWQAKRSSVDASIAIDVQLLCGAGLDETKAYLRAQNSDIASAALRYLLECEAARDFEDFSVEARSRRYSSYYAPKDL